MTNPWIMDCFYKTNSSVISICFSLSLLYLVPDKVDSIPSISMSLVDTKAIENLHATIVESEQRIVVEALVSNESAPLLQHDRSTYEEPFTGLASFVPSSRFRTCLCCSIL